MFLKTETGEFVNIDSIQAIEFLKLRTNGDEYSITLYLSDDRSYTGAVYNNKEDAKYALNFFFTTIQNTRNENRMFYEIPTQDCVNIYKELDKITKEIETSEETEQEN